MRLDKPQSVLVHFLLKNYQQMFVLEQTPEDRAAGNTIRQCLSEGKPIKVPVSQQRTQSVYSKVIEYSQAYNKADVLGKEVDALLKSAPDSDALRAHLKAALRQACGGPEELRKPQKGFWLNLIGLVFSCVCGDRKQPPMTLEQFLARAEQLEAGPTEKRFKTLTTLCAKVLFQQKASVRPSPDELGLLETDPALGVHFLRLLRSSESQEQQKKLFLKNLINFTSNA